MKKGFTLIELIVVIAIIAILAAIALPNLLASRVQANQAAAISVLKQYATAQVVFHSGKQGRNSANSNGGANGFGSSFPNLFYGQAVGNAVPGHSLALISQVVADATLGGAAAAGGVTEHPVTVVPGGGIALPGANDALHQGYFFQSDPDLAVGAGAGFATGFSALALPSNHRAGNNAYWLGLAGTVHLKAVGSNYAAAAAAAGSTPQTAAGMAGWSAL
jgi:prepilin-type N-terminal cleavage/methylation domain-containing protein